MNDYNFDVDPFMSLLKGDRLKRYKYANSIESKRKILLATILHYYVLRNNNFSHCKAMNLLSSNYISNKPQNYSNSHSKKLFIEVFSKNNKEVSIDVEMMRDRSVELYKYFFKKHKIKRNLSISIKRDFYLNWIKYEIGIKLKIEDWQSLKIKLLEYDNYLIGCSEFDYCNNIVTPEKILRIM